MVDTVRSEAATDAEPTAWAKFRSRLIRSSDDRVLAGVAGGIAAQLRIGTAYVRAAFVVLAFAGGVGVALYLLEWAFASDTEPTAAIERDLEDRKRVALMLMLIGTLIGLRGLDLWFGDAVVWSSLLVAFGIAAIWDRSDLGGSGVLAETAPGRVRIVVGAVLMLAGLAVFSGSIDSMAQLGPIVIAVGITAAGFMLVFGPWVMRLAGDLASERRERIRSEERTEMAAHLHDSVLQTLALIQRSDDPKQMITLARSQERELRGWLYGPERQDGETTLAEALEAAAGWVEQAHNVPVDVVVVKDVPVNGGLDALVKAASEAMNNAARHSGARRVSVYAEAVGGMVDVFVSDQGDGFDFDPGNLPDDRQGIRQSILGRMERHGGSATIDSEPGEGTEVHLEMPMEAT